ncbi:helix-turn-helix domain-containing protein [Flavobacterium sp. JP2137]|uniref:helix-turn-helix domain-containing protein n=1 Tax=Flavobacterium sp. JP2137 TaxID=3414510 RepID=UPI003D2FB191
MKRISAEAKYALQFINQTNRSIFLTGKAGTGKTTLLKQIIETTHKNAVVVAPTGIAALNAGGVTIHSFFHLPFAAFIPDSKSVPIFSDTVKFENQVSLRRHLMMNNTRKALFQNLELLIIDEVSMVRADVMDAMDFMLRRIRKNEQPYGGVQVLFIGDLLQLPPVVKQVEWEILKQYYRGNFFFHAHVIQKNPPLYIELDKIYRQSDDRFIRVLNNLRNNQVTSKDVDLLNEFVQPDFDQKKQQGYITLTTHNAKADAINNEALQELPNKAHTYYPELVGDFPEKIFPLEAKMTLKVGAQIIFIKNDLSFEKNFFNGKMGVIQSLSPNEIYVHFPEENKTIEVEKYEWQNIKYSVDDNTKEIQEQILGTYTQYPIKLAWAITVHKSQGLTFDRAVLDVSRVFLPGQAYVALSRLRSLEGLILLNPIQMNGLQNDADVMEYANQKANAEKLESELHTSTRFFIYKYLVQSFSWFDLSTQWRQHLQTYVAESDRSKKKQFHGWATVQSQQMDALLIHSEKFVNQLHQLFHAEPYDFDFVRERFDKAYSYFFPKIDRIVFEILFTVTRVRKMKMMKAFFEELSDLENSYIKAILQLMKAKLLIEALSANKEISKENLSSLTIGEYRINHLVAIAEILRSGNLDLDEDEEDEGYYEKPEKKTKSTKKPTTEITLELWKTAMSIAEIAETRKLTVQTIYGHLAKLIAQKSVAITEVLPAARIAELKAIVDSNAELSLSEIKEKVGDKFTWEELRLFKASTT